jgi:hypothetical protein
MNIRDAILKAADHIERHPSEFNFIIPSIPAGPGCGSPGCALGWIGSFAGMRGHYTDVAGKILGAENPIAFYELLTEAEGVKRVAHCDPGTYWTHGQWWLNAPACAAALRLYADKHHPAAVPPDWNAISMGRMPAKEMQKC